MSQQWYYNQDGAQYGPVDEAEVIRLIQDGELSTGSPVCPHGGSAWQSARSHSCFQVMVRPKKKTPAPVAPAPSPAPAPKRPVQKAPTFQPAATARPAHSYQGQAQPFSSPVPAVATGPGGEKMVWPWVVSGVAVLIGAVVIIVTLAMNESKTKPVVGPDPVVRVNLPSDPEPSGGNPQPSTANNLQLARSHMQRGMAFYTGSGSESKDFSEAMRWCLKAANMGLAAAQNHVGYMCGKGEGAVKSESEAVRWFRKAAVQGHALAQCNLGIHYANGQGVLEDDAEANKWYRMSALQGNASAQNNLGVQFAHGQGVTRNLVTAYAWYNLAAAEGNDMAIKNKTEISKIMSSVEIVQAQTLSHTLSTQIQNP